MTESKRLLGLDVARVVGILLLFPVHSGLSQVYPQVVDLLQYFFLGIFFYASGYLARPKGKSFRVFMKDKLLGIYLPFVIIAILCHLVYPARFQNNVLTDVTGLLLYAPFTLAGYDLWFIPALLLFFLITAAFRNRTTVLIGSFLALSVFQIATNATVLDWKVPIFAIVFLAGYLDTLYAPSGLLLLVPFAVLYGIADNGSVAQVMSINTFTTLLTVVPLMKMLTYMKTRSNLLELVAGSTLFIYLLEPLVSLALAERLYGVQFAEWVLPPEIWNLILVRMVITVVVGVAVGTAYGRLLALTRSRLRARGQRAGPSGLQLEAGVGSVGMGRVFAR